MPGEIEKARGDVMYYESALQDAFDAGISAEGIRKLRAKLAAAKAALAELESTKKHTKENPLSDNRGAVLAISGALGTILVGVGIYRLMNQPAQSSVPVPGTVAGLPVGLGAAPELEKLTFSNGTVLHVEVVRDRDELKRGLMFRKSLPIDQGMLFEFPDVKPHTFWMRNTRIPLDMLWLDEHGKIVGVVENVPILNDNIYGAHASSKYGLEVNAGWVRKHNIQVGQSVRFS